MLKKEYYSYGKKKEINLYLLPQEDVCGNVKQNKQKQFECSTLGFAKYSCGISAVSAVLFIIASSVPRTLGPKLLMGILSINICRVNVTSGKL